MTRLVWLCLAGCGRIAFDEPSQLPVGGVSSGTANQAFVTSTTYPATFGGIAAADAACMERATAAGLTGEYHAWLSTSAVTAFSRLVGSSGWRLVDGTPLADLPSDFATSATLAPLALDETGTDARAAVGTVWTGTETTGTSTTQTCGDWTANTAGTAATIGSVDGGGRWFSNTNVLDCSAQARFYCLEVGNVARVAVEPRAGRYAFVSSVNWRPAAGGIASADAECQLDARLAGLPGSYRALLGTRTQAPMSRFDLTRSAWIRVDGVQLAPTAEAFFTELLLDNFLARTATGAVSTAGTWGGDPMVVDGSCTDWTVPDDTRSGTTGATGRSSRALFAASARRCSLSAALLCLQQ